MMSLILMNFMFFFIINKFNKNYLQMIYQIFIFLMFFLLIILFPLNNLNLWVNFYYTMSMDYYSWGLIMLSLWIIPLMVMVSDYNIINKYYLYYIYLMNFIILILMLCFFTMNMMLFYIYFESSLIPVFLMIMGWGYQVERIQASFYMMLYTMFGSMPLFVIIMYLFLLENTLMMDMIYLKELNYYIYMSLTSAFFIKMPMYFTHLWLPKAHVEAPVTGSMILAGVMLKLGSYGLMRIMIMMLDMCLKFNKFFIIISLMGGFISSLICMLQVDLKLLVAYSSVVHMSILMSGLMTLFNWGYIGGYMMMISHGLCSSGMFFMVNVNYSRVMSRSLFINKGMINYLPSLSLMWFFLCSSNLSFPPSLNLFSEILLFNSLLMWSKMLMLMLMLISFLSATYTLYLYSYSQHGKMNYFHYFLSGGKINEFFIMMMHWIPLNLLFLKMNMFI